MYKSHELSVIVYGMGNSLDESIDYIEKRFRVVGFSDSDVSKADARRQKGLPFIIPSDIPQCQFDYILICSIYDDEIKSSLINDHHIPKAKILTRNDWCHIPVLCSYGEKNPNLTFYVIRKEIRLRNGLISLLISALEQLEFADKNNYIPIVDMKNYKNQYLEDEKLHIDNSWEYYFRQLTSFELDEVYQSKNVVLGYDYPNYLNDYDEEYDMSGMSEMFEKYIQILPDIAQHIEREYNLLFSKKNKVLGIVYRGSDYNALKLKHHSIQPSLEEFVINIKHYMLEWGCDFLYLCTEDEDALNMIKKEFGEKVFYSNQMRFSNTGDKWLSEIEFARSNDKFLRGLEYLTAIMLLTKCNCLLSGVCAASVFAHIVGGKHYEHVRIIKKGVY